MAKSAIKYLALTQANPMKSIYLSLLLLSNIMANAQTNFKATQMSFERVAQAYSEKWTGLNKVLRNQGYNDEFSMLINAYKSEGKLEVWLKGRSKKAYSLFRTYDFCAHSGVLGPKVIEGDKQTPEGFYYINVFNPMSSFHLSLGLNYPNTVDLARTGSDRKPGSDIYIHGNCVTVGCIPLTDDKIKELYILATEARNSGQERIPVSIYPFKMTELNMKKYVNQFPAQSAFWKTLRLGYLAFEKNKKQLNMSEVNRKYILK